MVTVNNHIVNPGAPCMIRSTRHTCDLCGCLCNQSGTRKERLYQYGEDQLCWECLWDVLFTGGVVEIVE